MSEPTAEMSDPDRTQASHDIPIAPHLAEAIARDWAPAPAMPHPARPDIGPFAAKRRARMSGAFTDAAVVVPAGNLKPRANDTDYGFRAESSFAWLTGEIASDAVLVLAPIGGTHEATLYVREFAQPGEIDYFTSRVHGAVWVGNVPDVPDTQATLGITTKPLTKLADDLAALHGTPVAALTGIDPSVDEAVAAAGLGTPSDARQTLDELRLVKDEWEVARLSEACEATARGFADVVRAIPAVLDRTDLRGERWLEGTFWRRARLEGNDVGYGSIVGAGAHGTTLHWWRNNGSVTSGQLLLADMGVETDALHTADVTRTFPVTGEWTPAQLKVYEAVREAQAAGIAEVRSGHDFLAAHRAASWVLADHLHHWGILSVTADVSCADDPERAGAGLHRRWTLHGVSHMLGLDVHDCATARDEVYKQGPLAAGYVLTVEPGLYFQVNDLSVPAELRGLATRIEDDILVTDGDPINLSAMLPREPREVTEWMRECQSTPAL